MALGVKPESQEPSSVSCASTNTIAALLAGAADPAAAERFEVHLDQCTACRRLVAELGRGLSAIDHASPRAALPRIGDAVGRYTLQQLIGVGGMGVVYRAHDTRLDREVALKLLRPDLLEGPSLLAEAQAMARLQHPNIVSVHDAGIANGQLYVCMEYVAGTTLRAATQGQPWRAIVDMYRAAGEGLAFVHRAKLVHLDFKPDNVLVDRDRRVRVTDFGLARRVGTRDDRIVGTPAYMPPEQRTSGRIDARADQYAFCASLREALGDDAARLGRVLERGLSPHPDDRYRDMDTLLATIADATRPRRFPVAIGLVASAAVATALLLPQPTHVITNTIDRPRTVWRDRDEPLTQPSAPAPVPAVEASAMTSPPPVHAARVGAELQRALTLHVARVLSRRDTAMSMVSTTTTATSEAIDGAAPDDAMTACDDGSAITCNLWPPSCPAGTSLAAQSGCWTCAEPQSCMSLGFPSTCNDGSPLRCSQEPPTCPGRAIAAIRNGCWSCQDPFTCWSRLPHPHAAPPRRPPARPTHTGSNTGSDGGGGSVCGNGFCEVGEDHVSCAGDCCETGANGACLAQCGNGFCESGEDHGSCASDCCETTSTGACAPVCGNGFCEEGETCPGECS
jgi:serine/threonine protein kinase